MNFILFFLRHNSLTNIVLSFFSTFSSRPE
nr:MAG TPA: hypothetical protein [Crassvirales sp.]